MHKLITHLVNQQKKASPIELAQIIEHIATAPFSADLLDVDQVLWGSFWHFDVISPGYRLPALELALLRATRLDDHWPQDTAPEQYLADLHQTIQHPHAGIWTLLVAQEPCVVIAAPTANPKLVLSGAQRAQAEVSKTQNLKSVVWYCASTGHLHAGYRTTAGALRFTEAIEQRSLESRGQAEHVPPRNWVTLTVEQREVHENNNLATRLDVEILRWRLM